MERFQSLVHIFQKFHCIGIHAPLRHALPVNGPADGIHPEPVHMVFSEPVFRRRLQEASHFAPGMHEVPAAPLTVSHVIVRVFIERRAVVIGQRVSIHREMHRHKIQDHTNSLPVAGVHESPQLIRRPVPGCGTVESGSLIPPGFIARVLIQRHDLHIIVSVFLHVRDQDIRHLLIIIPGVRLLSRLLKRSEMYLIYVQRLCPVVGSALHPLLIPEPVRIRLPDNRRCIGPELHPVSVRVAVIDKIARPVIDPVLIHHAGLRLIRNKFPEIPVIDLLHRTLRPVIEFPDHRDPRRHRCERAEDGLPPPSRFFEPDVRAQIFIRVKTFSCIEAVVIHVFTPFHREIIDTRRFLSYNEDTLKANVNTPAVPDKSRINDSCLKLSD